MTDDEEESSSEESSSPTTQPIARRGKFEDEEDDSDVRLPRASQILPLHPFPTRQITQHTNLPHRY